MVDRQKKHRNPVDVRIGENLIRLRGDFTQAELASNMRKNFGFPWSQATVWNVETGERPLRLAEANALAWLLDIPLEELLFDPVAQEKKKLTQALFETNEATSKALESISAAGKKYMSAYDLFEKLKDGGNLSEAEVNEFIAILETPAKLFKSLSDELVGEVSDLRGNKDSES